MITFIRKHLLNAYTSLPVLVCLLFTSWSTYAKPLTPKAAHRFSGEDMFRGLFFLEGQYAQAIPELQSLRMSYSQPLMKATNQAALTQLRHEMIQRIKAQRPHYFEQFRAAMESGNYLTVQAALAEGKTVATKTVERLYNLDTRQLVKFQHQAANLAQEGKLTKQSLDQMAKAMNKNQFASRQGNGTGTCLVIFPYCTIVAMCMVVLMVTATEELAQNDSSLLNDQLVASICRLAGPHA